MIMIIRSGNQQVFYITVCCSIILLGKSNCSSVKHHRKKCFTFNRIFLRKKMESHGEATGKETCLSLFLEKRETVYRIILAKFYYDGKKEHALKKNLEKSVVVKHELRVTSFQLRVESLKAQIEIQKCNFKTTSHEFKILEFKFMSYELKSRSYEIKSTSSRIF